MNNGIAFDEKNTLVVGETIERNIKIFKINNTNGKYELL
jgi:hypothetical protein